MQGTLTVMKSPALLQTHLLLVRIAPSAGKPMVRVCRSAWAVSFTSTWGTLSGQALCLPLQQRALLQKGRLGVAACLPPWLVTPWSLSSMWGDHVGKEAAARVQGGQC